jgi:hypothetical protein
MILNWEESTKKITDRIQSNNGFLKIILKTFNDGFFLEKWIKHHANIVGLENLIIADNMSTDEDVLTIYERYKEDIVIFRFAGNHNLIHDRGRYKFLYDAVQASSTYHLFIDTDEFLVWINENEWYADGSILDKLKFKTFSDDLQDIIPTTTIHNALHSEIYFSMSLISGLTWGKPLVSNKINPVGMPIHNVQFSEKLFQEKRQKISPNLFLLHLDSLSTKQRIKTNKAKLVKYGCCKDDDSIETILSKDYENWSIETTKRFVYEIKILLEHGDNVQKFENIPNNSICFLETGYLNFSSEKEKRDLINFFEEYNFYIKKALYNKSREDINNAIEYRVNGDFIKAKKLFESGIIEHPSYLDEYGHPSFKKELMRMLLSLQKWDEAKILIPKYGDFGGDNWHENLLARAYYSSGDFVNSLYWINISLKNEPNNDELNNLKKSVLDTLNTSNIIELDKDFINIPSQPHMEDEGILLLKIHLERSVNFLEYGAGGSTILAAKIGVENIYSVESDNLFLDAIKQKVLSIYPHINIYTFFIDIGKTKEWGYPINNEKLHSWKNYCSTPWNKILISNQYPDLILIDGRFRVSCFLICLLFSKIDTVILFDDYVDRPYYHIIEKYIKPKKVVGRMAEFLINKEFSENSIILDLIDNLNNPV